MEPDSAIDKCQTFHPWPRMPAELQLEVLGHHLTSRFPIDREEHSILIGKGDLSSMIGVRNRHLVGLSLEAYYKHNTFMVDSYYDVHQLRFPPPKHCHRIRHLILVLGECLIGDSATKSFFSECSEWKCILAPEKQPTPPPDGAGHTFLTWEDVTQFSEWYRLIPNLKSFELDIEIDSRGNMSVDVACDVDLCDRTLSTLASGRIRVHASQYEVSVRNHACPAHSPDEWPRSSCRASEKIIERCLLSMLTKKRE